MTKQERQIAVLISSHECPPAARLERLATWNECRDELTDRLAHVLEASNPEFSRADFIATANPWRGTVSRTTT